MQIVIDKLIKLLVNYKYKKYQFLAWSWGLNENTDIHIISEECCHDKHRYGVRENSYADSN